MGVQITVIGNVVKTPEVRYTKTGKAVADVRIGATPARKNEQSGTWEDIGEPVYITHTLWEEEAENAAELYPKGTRVVLAGATLAVEKYTDRDGVAQSGLKTVGRGTLAVCPARGEKKPTGAQQGTEYAPQQGTGAEHDPWQGNGGAPF